MPRDTPSVNDRSMKGRVAWDSKHLVKAPIFSSRPLASANKSSVD